MDDTAKCKNTCGYSVKVSLTFHRIPQYLISSDLSTEHTSESCTSGEHNGDEAFEDSSEGHWASDSEANDRLSASQ